MNEKCDREIGEYKSFLWEYCNSRPLLVGWRYDAKKMIYF